MKVQEAIQIIKEQILQCERDGEMFDLPKMILFQRVCLEKDK